MSGMFNLQIYASVSSCCWAYSWKTYSKVKSVQSEHLLNTKSKLLMAMWQVDNFYTSRVFVNIFLVQHIFFSRRIHTLPPFIFPSFCFLQTFQLNDVYCFSQSILFDFVIVSHVWCDAAGVWKKVEIVEKKKVPRNTALFFLVSSAPIYHSHNGSIKSTHLWLLPEGEETLLWSCVCVWRWE